MFNWAVEQEAAADTNPIAGLKKRAREAAATRTLTDAEIHVLWDALTRSEEDTPDVALALKRCS